MDSIGPVGWVGDTIFDPYIMNTMPWCIQLIDTNSERFFRIVDVDDIVLTAVVDRIYMVLIDECIMNTAGHIIVVRGADGYVVRVRYI